VRPEHVQWSFERFKKWSQRETGNSIVVVILPLKNPPKNIRLSDHDILEYFSADGIIQDLYFDRSGNFAIIQFDDVIPISK
jgi:hypothetical protein